MSAHNVMKEAPTTVGASTHDIVELIKLAYQMHYYKSRLARRLGVERVALYQYLHGQHTPRPPVRILARQLREYLIDGLKGPLRLTPTMRRGVASDLIDRYLDEKMGKVLG